MVQRLWRLLLPHPPLMLPRWCIQGGRILAGTSGVALCADLSLPPKAVGISLLKKYCEDCGAKMDGGADNG